MDNSQRLNELFNQARNQAPKTSFEQTKSSFTTAVKSGGTSSLLSKIKSFKTLFIMALSTIILGVGLTYFNTTTPTLKLENVAKSETKTNIITLESIEKVEPKTAQISAQKMKNKEPIVIKRNGIITNQQKAKAKQPTEEVTTTITDVVEEKYDFPILTKKQKEDNLKQKNIMLRGLARYNRMPAINNIDERIYPMVYWNKPIVVGKATSIDATNSFHIQSTEVSNLEYRTFLFDLLMKDKKEAFLKAKPNQELWLKEYPKGYEKEAQFMKDNYFSNSEYNDYPVVAISLEGAEMYCEWLTEERNNLNPEKYGKLVSRVRLPKAKEWVQAAKGKSVSSIYSSGNTIKNERGCYLVNFMPGKNTTTSCIENTNENAYAADGGFSTVKVSSYNPNGGGLFNMSGNVAEMVYYEDENNIAGAKGGSWMSTEEELKINGEDSFKGKLVPSIKVGFRPVITYVSGGDCAIADDEYRFPNLSPMQIEENNKIKANMLKDLSKFDKKKYAFIPSGETKIKNKKVSINAFYMQTTEVSVLEYRTFLYDLLIQNRKDDFLIAKPDQTQWAKYGEQLKPMEVNYFSHPAYDNYPMNNVSKAGVELYCKWLNEEQTKMYGKTINDVRLPTVEEWMYAAKGGKDTNIYPWGIPDTKNSRGCYLANFKPGVRTNDCGDSWNKLSNVSADSLSNYVQTGDDVILPKQSKDIYSADGGYYTVKVNSYSPNYFGLYNISGNVAEMVIANDGGLDAKGGGWNSIGQQLQIEAANDFENVGEPNTEIGFRVVITYANDKRN